MPLILALLGAFFGFRANRFFNLYFFVTYLFFIVLNGLNLVAGYREGVLVGENALTEVLARLAVQFGLAFVMYASAYVIFYVLFGKKRIEKS